MSENVIPSGEILNRQPFRIVTALPENYAVVQFYGTARYYHIVNFGFNHTVLKEDLHNAVSRKRGFDKYPPFSLVVQENDDDGIVFIRGKLAFCANSYTTLKLLADQLMDYLNTTPPDTIDALLQAESTGNFLEEYIKE